MKGVEDENNLRWNKSIIIIFKGLSFKQVKPTFLTFLNLKITCLTII